MEDYNGHVDNQISQEYSVIGKYGEKEINNNYMRLTKVYNQYE